MSAACDCCGGSGRDHSAVEPFRSCGQCDGTGSLDESAYDQHEEEEGCCMPDRCLCPHPYHGPDECHDEQMMEAYAMSLEPQR
jgi:hypothetical protein